MKSFLAVFVSGVLLTVAITGFSLFSQGYIAINSDNFFNHWILQYNQKALNDGSLFSREYFNSPQYYPFPQSLALADTVIFPSLAVYTPLSILTNNPILSFNLFIFAAFVLTFVSAFFSINYLVKNNVAAFLAAIIYTYPPLIFVRLTSGHIEYLNRYFVAPLIVSSIYFFEKPSPKRALLMSALFFLSWTTSIQLTVISVIFIAIFFLYFFFLKIRSRERIVWLKDIIRWGLLLLPFLILIYVLYLPYLEFNVKEGIGRSIKDVIYFSGSFWNLLMPNSQNILFGDLFKRFYRYKIENAEFVLFPGFLPYVLFFASLLIPGAKNKYGLMFVFGFIVSVVLMLGPYFFVMGKQLTLPYWYLYKLYFPLHAIRTPTRIMIVSFFFFSISISFFIKTLLEHKKTLTVLLAGICLMILILEYRQNMRVYSLPEIAPINHNLMGKKVIFLPLNEIEVVTAQYLMGSIKAGYVMLNGTIGTTINDHKELKTLLNTSLFSDRMLSILKSIETDYVIINKKYPFYVARLEKSVFNNFIVYDDDNWILIDIKKIPFDECVKSSYQDLNIKEITAVDLPEGLGIEYTLENLTGCNLSFLRESRYVPMSYEIVTSEKTIIGSRYMKLPPYLLKGEEVKRREGEIITRDPTMGFVSGRVSVLNKKYPIK